MGRSKVGEKNHEYLFLVHTETVAMHTSSPVLTNDNTKADIAVKF